MNFLTAHWEHLLLANYFVHPDVLQPFVPRGTTLDRFDGQTIVSLVAFRFRSTRIVGLPIPFHRHFEEVNLRFYVTPDRDKSLRAVSFVREIVPRSAIVLVANNLFRESYVKLPLTYRNEEASHWYGWENGSANSVSGRIDGELAYPEVGSIDEFITEHYWGYARAPNRTLEYRVQHPRWKCCSLKEYQIQVDFNGTYGEAFDFLNRQQPFSMLYANGSRVSVSFPKRLPAL